MSFYKSKRTNNGNNDFVQTIFANEVEKKTNPIKKYYGLIKVGEKLYIDEYEGKFRSEALAVFNETARLMGGTLDTFSVKK